LAGISAEATGTAAAVAGLAAGTAADAGLAFVAGVATGVIEVWAIAAAALAAINRVRIVYFIGW
jgi:hypothetical protein